MAQPKQFWSTPSPFEKDFAFYRSVRKGPFIFVSGTTALKYREKGGTSEGVKGDSKVYFPKDAGKQAKICMERCVEAVEKLGGKIEDVVRVKMFVTNYDDCATVGAAFKETFGYRPGNSEIGAAATMIVVRDGFVDPDILVEVEVDALTG